MGKLFYLMGKSASGKDTIYKKLLERCSWLQRVVPYTTRPMRDGEKDGVEYHFITPEQLEGFEKNKKVIERRTYETVAGPWTYATVDDGHMNLDTHDYLAIGTLESYEKVLHYYGPESVRPVYITVEDGERMERALLRERAQHTPNYAELCRRYLADEADFAPENLSRCGIFSSFRNDSLARCMDEISEYIQNGSGYAGGKNEIAIH